jgi:hypothetical protein
MKADPAGSAFFRGKMDGKSVFPARLTGLLPGFGARFFWFQALSCRKPVIALLLRQ